MSDANDNLETCDDRLDSIDQFRGFAILLMVLADYLSRIQRVPGWLKHAPGVGLTVVDLIAPMFILSIGLTFRPSFQRRLLRSGGWQTTMHFIRRFLALMGIGVITPPGYSWGLFQTIGGAGLLSLLVIRLPSQARLAIGGIVLGGYQFLSDNIWVRRVSANSSWCEFEGVISWGAMLILASALADWYYDRPRGLRFFSLGSLVLVGLGVLLSNWIEISQYYVSASYVLIGLGASGLFFWAFHLLTEKLKVHIPLLISWGKSPLVLYLLHYWIWIYVFLWPLSSSWYIQAPVWLIILQAMGYVGLLSLVARFLDRRGWIVSL